MKRRSLTGILTFALSDHWRQAAGQSPAPRIGYLWLGTPGSDETTKSGLLKGLEELGYSDGGTISIDYRYADGNEARLAPLLAELIAAKPALLVTPGVVATRAAMNATRTVPIVSASTDPVGSGFAISLARPGRNITGVAITAGAEVAAKWVEFARELVPNATRIALLLNPSSSASAIYAQSIRSLAGPLGLVLTFHGVTDRQELADALDSIAAANPQVLIVDADALLYANKHAIVAFANLAQTVYQDVSLTSPREPQTEIWFLLYAQVKRVDGQAWRNILLEKRPGGLHGKVLGLNSVQPSRSQRTDIPVEGVFLQSEVQTQLRKLGLPPNTPTSVLAVELFNDEANVVRINSDGARDTMEMSQTPVANMADPLGGELGSRRVLRVSPLTSVRQTC